MYGWVVLTTGVLAREPGTICAFASVVNLDADETYGVTVEVWDWSDHGSPSKLPVLIGEDAQAVFPHPLPPRRLAVLYADLDQSGVTLYEVRVIHPLGANVVANCFGGNIPPNMNAGGSTVFHKQMVAVDPRVSLP